MLFHPAHPLLNYQQVLIIFNTFLEYTLSVCNILQGSQIIWKQAKNSWKFAILTYKFYKYIGNFPMRGIIHLLKMLEILLGIKLESINAK